MSFASFWSDILATVIGGIALAFLFFISKEKLFPLPPIIGRWYFEQKTQTSAYKPYTAMVLRYVAMLHREGSRIEGTAEKIYENSSTGERDFIGKNRTRATISGYIEKNYFGKDMIYIHIIETGHGRESTHFYEMSADCTDMLSGIFSSMVADQSGTVKWQRNPF